MWLRPGGYTIRTGPDGVMEADSMTCVHCNRVTFIPARCSPEDMGGRCTCCGGLICKHCVGKGCHTLEQKLQEWERSEDRR